MFMPWKLRIEKMPGKLLKGDWTPKFIASITIVGFLTYIFMITIYPINEDADDAINLILGYFSGIASAIVSFYYGSSNKKE